MDDAKFLLLFVLVGFTAFISRRYRTLPFVAIILVTCLFCLLLRTDLTWVARSFHSGFGQSLAAGGLTVLAGLLVAAIGQAHGAMSRWREALSARARALGLAGANGNKILLDTKDVLLIVAMHIGGRDGRKAAVIPSAALGGVHGISAQVKPGAANLHAVEIRGGVEGRERRQGSRGAWEW